MCIRDRSIFGTGVLLFGTPLLLILGYNFQYALIILLPTSILINFFQLKNNFNKIDIRFYKRLFLFSIALIILFLYFTNSNTIRIKFKNSFKKFILQLTIDNQRSSIIHLELFRYFSIAPFSCLIIKNCFDEFFLSKGRP